MHANRSSMHVCVQYALQALPSHVSPQILAEKVEQQANQIETEKAAFHDLLEERMAASSAQVCFQQCFHMGVLSYASLSA